MIFDTNYLSIIKNVCNIGNLNDDIYHIIISLLTDDDFPHHYKQTLMSKYTYCKLGDSYFNNTRGCSYCKYQEIINGKNYTEVESDGRWVDIRDIRDDINIDDYSDGLKYFHTYSPSIYFEIFQNTDCIMSKNNTITYIRPIAIAHTLSLDGDCEYCDDIFTVNLKLNKPILLPYCSYYVDAANIIRQYVKKYILTK